MPKRVRDGPSGRRLSTWSVHTAASNDAIDAYGLLLPDCRFSQPSAVHGTNQGNRKIPLDLAE